jgi:hypothetical protein
MPTCTEPRGRCFQMIYIACILAMVIYRFTVLEDHETVGSYTVIEE